MESASLNFVLSFFSLPCAIFTMSMSGFCRVSNPCKCDESSGKYKLNSNLSWREWFYHRLLGVHFSLPSRSGSFSLSLRYSLAPKLYCLRQSKQQRCQCLLCDVSYQKRNVSLRLDRSIANDLCNLGHTGNAIEVTVCTGKMTTTMWLGMISRTRNEVERCAHRHSV